MAELIHAKQLAWKHLHLLEDPFFAKWDVETAVRAYESRSGSGNRGISNFQAWYESVKMPPGELTRFTLHSLNNGDSFYVSRFTEVPKRPLLFWKITDASKGSDDFYGKNGRWEVHDHVNPALRNKLRTLLTRIQPPKPVVLRQEATQAESSAQKKEAKAEVVKHQILLETECENDCPMPPKHYVTLVGFNKSTGSKRIHQMNDVVHDTDSRVFSGEQGDEFEVFAITDKMPDVKKDLRNSGNLNQSVQQDQIKALEETSTHTRADGVVVHVYQYVIPEIRNLEINSEYGNHEVKPASDMLVLVHEDSGWTQTIFVGKRNPMGYVEYEKDGWVKIVFEDIPKSGKFSLYSYNQKSDASPVSFFTDKTEEDLYNEPEPTLAEAGEPLAPPETDSSLYDEALAWDEWLDGE